VYTISSQNIYDISYQRKNIFCHTLGYKMKEFTFHECKLETYMEINKSRHYFIIKLSNETVVLWYEQNLMWMVCIFNFYDVQSMHFHSISHSSCNPNSTAFDTSGSNYNSTLLVLSAYLKLLHFN
jgi:hypothetical protein